MKTLFHVLVEIGNGFNQISLDEISGVDGQFKCNFMIDIHQSSRRILLRAIAINE